MKKFVFVLLALLLIPAAQAMAQAPQPPVPAASAVTSPAPVPTDKAEFLESLAAGQGLNDLTPAPTFTAACTSNSQCPKGQLCCIPCGADIDCGRTCLNAVNGHCPWFV